MLSAHYRRPLPKDALIDILWPGADSSSGPTSLKVTVHKLRQALDPDKTGTEWVIIDSGTYRLNPNVPVWIDTEAFRELYQRGCALDAEARSAEALECLRKAEALYRGDYLEEDMYEDWTVIRREELRDLYLDTLHRLAQLALRENAHADVIQYCHKIVLADPCREDAYRMLMGSHASLSQYAGQAPGMRSAGQRCSERSARSRASRRSRRSRTCSPRSGSPTGWTTRRNPSSRKATEAASVRNRWLTTLA